MEERSLDTQSTNTTSSAAKLRNSKIAPYFGTLSLRHLNLSFPTLFQSSATPTDNDPRMGQSDGRKPRSLLVCSYLQAQNGV